MRKSVLLRADGGAKLGMGHLMRSAVIFKALKKENIDARLVSFKKKMSWREESEVLCRLAERVHAQVIVLDIDNIRTRATKKGFNEFIDRLRTAGNRVIALDGPAGQEYRYDALVVPYVGASKTRVPSARMTEKYYGPQYFILRDEFLVKGNKSKQKAKGGVRRILITMGGSDPGNFTAKALRALSLLKNKARVKVVVGPAFRQGQIEAIRKAASALNGFCEIQFHVKNMAPLMRWADLALVSGGLTKYELASMGVPGITLAQHDEEDRITTLFSRSGSVMHLGLGKDLKERVFAKAIEDLSGKEKKRAQMSVAGRRIVDGLGLKRVVNIIKDKLNG